MWSVNEMWKSVSEQKKLCTQYQIRNTHGDPQKLLKCGCIKENEKLNLTDWGWNNVFGLAKKNFLQFRFLFLENYY